jgi:DNA-binding IscR family transcriptional regulator
MIGNRFAVAIHILSLLAVSQDVHTTSNFLARSIGTNPVVVRRISKLLENAGLIHIRAGVGGSVLAQSPDDITLLDVYRAVESGERNTLFAIHERPLAACPVGANIQTTLDRVFTEAHQAMAQVLQQRTLRNVVEDLQSVQTAAE